MEEDFKYIELFELYKNLLTENQRELFSSHYLYDLSLAEIAEPTGKSRQSVYDAIKKVKIKLDEYEGTLGIKKREDALKELAEKVSKKDSAVSDKILEIIGR